jgi:hypothetical protein
MYALQVALEEFLHPPVSSQRDLGDKVCIVDLPVEKCQRCLQSLLRQSVTGVIGPRGTMNLKDVDTEAKQQQQQDIHLMHCHRCRRMHSSSSVDDGILAMSTTLEDGPLSFRPFSKQKLPARERVRCMNNYA